MPQPSSHRMASSCTGDGGREPAPRVSVLMPTFKQAAFIRRALESLHAQTFTDWELIIVDDGSPDDTWRVLAPYRDDARIRYHRLDAHAGLGAALNHATAHARGRYLAYLPSDDLYYPAHLACLVALLDARPDVYLAYGGVRWAYQRYGPTLQGEEAVGREAETLAAPLPGRWDAPLPNGNILALVQVLHRRDHEPAVRWTLRSERVSDTLEPDYWRALLVQGARFAYAGALTCAWVAHPDQRHTLIAGPEGGLARYRQHYGIGRGEWLNWQPSRGPRVDERARYGRVAVRRALPEPGGLRILLVGALGFNPERILAFEERGHTLYGLWVPRPERWDSAGPVPYGHIDDIPYDRSWPDRVRALNPDVIYALLNWQALPLIAEVLDADLGIPLVFHFKEGPFIALEHGLWPTLMRVLAESDGQIFISDENRAWFHRATDGALDPASTHILDGDLPPRAWFTDDWSPKLSARDGAIHTVCPGRPLGLDPFEDIARAGIHVHFYGEHFAQQHPVWTKTGLATGYMHLHPTVEPAEWVRELSRYDAAWLHVFTSHNDGDLRRATWDDLNLPARLGTYAAAGLPWILKDNWPSRVALQQLAARHDIGVVFTDFADLAGRLRDGSRLGGLTANMRAARAAFAFETHVEDLIAFFRRVIARQGRARP
ncbi:MAG: glycosyltransferase family 2 protein, partial [Chloroflexi bacterium]|nr:glycosyltransferase family 2 protein [Chloroflexota bacterium]